jgi:hypothetical protein
MATFAASFKFAGPYVAPEPLSGKLPQGIHETSTTQNYALLTRVTAVDPILGLAEFVYAKGVASTTVGEGIQLNPDGTTIRAAGGAAVGHIGVPMSANVANQYGWYCVKGRVPVKIADDVTANLQGYLAAAGIWADDVAGTKLVAGSAIEAGLNAGGSAIVGTTDTTAANFAIALIHYPYAIKAV